MAAPPPVVSADLDLDLAERRAGAIVAERGGHRVVVGYGSPAGELAACVSAVGLAECSDVMTLALDGPAEQLGALVERFTGTSVAVGGAARRGGAWWCAVTSERVLVVCDAAARGRRLSAALTRGVERRAAVSVRDVSADTACLAVVGRRAPALLSELGAFGSVRDPRRVAPVRAASTAGVPVVWLLAADDQAVALAHRRDATVLWRAILDTGRRFGICCVGQDALARYALLRRGAGAR